MRRPIIPSFTTTSFPLLSQIQFDRSGDFDDDWNWNFRSRRSLQTRRIEEILRAQNDGHLRSYPTKTGDRYRGHLNDYIEQISTTTPG